MLTYQLQTEFRSCTSITAEVEDAIAKSGIYEGVCHVSVMKPTIGLCITSFWDKRGLDDLLDEIDRNFPTRVSYLNQYSPYDASGQVKSAVMGNRLSLPIIEGKVLLGSSQGVVLIEFDGPRKREFQVDVVKMKMYSKKLNLKTEYMGVHSLLEETKKVVDESGVLNGICHLSCMHSTAGLGRTSKNGKAKQDHMARLETMVPTRVDFKHRETASDAGGHIKTALFRNQLDILISKGQLIVPEGEDICFFEYDGPRPRNVVVSIMEGKV